MSKLNRNIDPYSTRLTFLCPLCGETHEETGSLADSVNVYAYDGSEYRSPEAEVALEFGCPNRPAGRNTVTLELRSV